MQHVENLKNLTLIIDNNKLKLIYSKYLNKKKHKLKIQNFKDSKLHCEFIIGYKIDNKSGEYTSVKLYKNKVIIETDFVSSYPIYYTNNKNSLILSTSIIDIHRLDSKSIDVKKSNLKEHYIFGYCVSKNKTIYKNIKVFEPNTYNIIYKNKITSKKNKKIITKKKIRLFQYLLNKKQQKLSLRNSFLPLTGGIDSNILARKLIDNKIKFDCGVIGNKNSFDAKIGKKNAKLLNKKFLNFNQNYEKENKIFSLLKDYAILTSGSGISTEILLLEMVKKLSNQFRYILLGGGGEFYRNYFKSKKSFLSNYLTEKKTLKKFLKNEFYNECYSYIETFKNDKIFLKKFYLEKRYPRNTNRKILYMKNFIYPINLFVDETLYKDFCLSKKNIYDYFDTHPHYKELDKQKINAFNLNNFFKLVKPFLLNELQNAKNLDKINICKDKTINHLKKNNLTLRDKWFLLRVLNLVFYLNLNIKDKNICKFT